MGLERNPREQETIVDVFTEVHANYQMKISDYVVRGRCGGLGHHYPGFTITLPDVARAAGKFYSILARHADLGHVITIHDQHDSECWEGDYALNAPCECVLLYSDGLKWWDVGKELYGTQTVSPTTEVTTSNQM